jgi:regulatory protein
MSPDRGSSALKAMQRVCSMREYCESDILSKLERFELNPGEAEKILESLKADKFVEDNRYSQAFVRDKSRLSGWGSRKISFALRRKKIEQNIINEAIKELDKTSEAERLLKILTVKAKTIGKEESRAKKTGKLIRFALSRGFDYEQALSAVNKIIG